MVIKIIKKPRFGVDLAVFQAVRAMIQGGDLMHRASRMALVGFGMSLTMWPAAGASRAGAITGYNIVDIGPNPQNTPSESPHIDDNGNLAQFAYNTRGAYTIDSDLDPRYANTGIGIFLDNYLRKGDSKVNLLPAALQDPTALLNGSTSSGDVLGNYAAGHLAPFVYSTITGQFTDLKGLPGVAGSPTSRRSMTAARSSATRMAQRSSTAARRPPRSCCRTSCPARRGGCSSTRRASMTAGRSSARESTPPIGGQTSCSSRRRLRSPRRS